MSNYKCLAMETFKNLSTTSMVKITVQKTLFEYNYFKNTKIYMFVSNIIVSIEDTYLKFIPKDNYRCLTFRKVTFSQVVL